MQFDHEVDWLVAGAGAAGMTAAITAHEEGASVLVVEKEALYGGTTAKSGGVAWIPGNHRQVDAGIDDSPEEGYRYLKGLIGDSVPDARLRAFAERGPEMLAFMHRHSHVTYTPLPEYMDYYEHVPGYRSGGRSMDPGAFSLRKLGAAANELRIGHYDGILMPFNVTVVEGKALSAMDWRAYLTGAVLLGRYLLDLPARLRRQRDNRVTLGPALIARLRKSLLDRDVPVWLNAPVTELLTVDDRIVGAVVQRDGVPLRVRARLGVLLATGGFSQNAELRRTYQRAPITGDWTASAPGATGDAIRLGLVAGADLGFMGSAWWSPTYRIPDGRVLALIAGKSNPGSIIVNGNGHRFTNEAQPYEDFVKAQYDDNDATGGACIPAYLVFDHGFRSRYPLGHIRPGKVSSDDDIPKDYFSSGLLTRADSIEALAEALNMDATALRMTVDRFNEHARKGEDPEFDRGATLHDRYYADPRFSPNPSLGPLETGPFYAMRIEPGDLDTKGGLACDEYARVVRPDGSIIDGLYAAGNASAAVMGDTYPGAGATIGSAMTFGYIAARHACGDSDQSAQPAQGATP